MKYVVVPKAQLTTAMLRDCVEKAYVRESVDGTLVVIKYAGMKPLSLLSYDDLAHADALTLMSTSAWRQAMS